MRAPRAVPSPSRHWAQSWPESAKVPLRPADTKTTRRLGSLSPPPTVAKLCATQARGLIPDQVYFGYPLGREPFRCSGTPWASRVERATRSDHPDRVSPIGLLDEAAPQRENHGVGPIGGPKFRDECLDPLLHRVLSENHRACDLLVRIPLREVAKELELAWRQGVAHRNRGTRLGGLLRLGQVVVLLEPFGHLSRLHSAAQRVRLGRAERGQTADGSLERGDNLGGGRVLRDIPVRAGTHDRADHLPGSVDTEGDDRNGCRHFADALDGLGTGGVGKAEIQKDDVGSVLSHEVERLGACRRDPCDDQTFTLEKSPHPQAHHRMVLHGQYPNVGWSRGGGFHIGMCEQRESIHRACRKRLVRDRVCLTVPREADANSAAPARLDPCARVERGFATLLVLGVQREEAAVERANRYGVMPE